MKIATVAAACVLTIGVSLYFFLQDPRFFEGQITASQHDSIDKKVRESTEAKVSANKDKKSDQTRLAHKKDAVAIHSHQNEIESTVNEEDLDRSFWFNEPSLESDTHFVLQNTEVLASESCNNHAVLTKKPLESMFSDTHHIDARERFPEDLFYYTLTQFWQLEGRYYQFVAIWERDMPARYRYEFYTASQADFRDTVTPLKFPLTPPKLRDVQETNQFITELLDHYTDKGATLGARIIEAAVNTTDGEEQVVFVNAKLTQWSTHDFACNGQAKSQYARCDCILGKDA